MEKTGLEAQRISENIGRPDLKIGRYWFKNEQ